jgi:1,2-diacylglycerol 3-alpha-glucosyltransferase
LLFLGRLDSVKKNRRHTPGSGLALKVVDFCFVIAGKGVNKKSLENQTRNLGIQESVIFTGFVTDEELADIYKLSSCFIISSSAELLGLNTLQDMAAGLPVIAVDAGALGELIQPGENGLLHKIGDIKEMAGNICTIFSNTELRLKMKAKSCQLARNHDIKQTVQSFEALYRKTLEMAG